MKKYIFLCVILCLALLVSFKFSAFDIAKSKYSKEYAGYKKAPNFTLESLEGKSVSLNDYTGKGVVLFFWTTWCPHCRRELSQLNREYNNMIDSGIELLAIDVGEPKIRVNNFIRDYSIKYPILFDHTTDVAHSYGVVGVPTIILISKKGKIIESTYTLPSNYRNLLLEK